MKIVLGSLLALSVVLNVVLAAAALYMGLTGCAEIANGRVGVLVRDLPVGRFGGSDAIFTLPRGLVVRDASATGADWFEPHRFRIVVTTEDTNLVDFSAGAALPDDRSTEYYSADLGSEMSNETGDAR